MLNVSNISCTNCSLLAWKIYMHTSVKEKIYDTIWKEDYELITGKLSKDHVQLSIQKEKAYSFSLRKQKSAIRILMCTQKGYANCLEWCLSTHKHTHTHTKT